MNKTLENHISSKEKNKIPFLKYLILCLVILNLPGFALTYINSTVSSALSYLSYILIILYVILNGKTGNNPVMLILGVLYFLTGSIAYQNFMPDFSVFMIIVVKYFIIIWGGHEVMKNTSNKELFIFIIIGAISVVGNMFLFNDPKADYGRYSGFYLDPNNAGLICLIGYSLTFVMRKKISLLSKSYFLIIGLFTFSRTFIISWILINLLSIKLNIKNLKLLLIGFGFLSTLLVYNSFLPVKNQRLEQIGALINGGSATKSSKIEKDSRWDTWSRYYPALMDKPIFGNGFNSFTGNGVAPPVGVHNTYLLLWGEGGILSALLFLFYTIWLFIKSSKIFMTQPHVLMILLGLSLFLLTNHNFMTANYSIFILLWIHIQVKETSKKEDLINLKVNTIET